MTTQAAPVNNNAKVADVGSSGSSSSSSSSAVRATLNTWNVPARYVPTIKLHNLYRCMHGAPPLYWNAEMYDEMPRHTRSVHVLVHKIKNVEVESCAAVIILYLKVLYQLI